MTAPSISDQASVAPTEGNLKRSIQMSFFAKPSDHLKVGLAYSDDASATKGDVGKSSKVLGQIVGYIGAVDQREGVLPNGEPSTSLVAIGEFEAVAYAKPDEVVQSLAAYLPRYYLESAAAALRNGVAGIELAVEIVLVPTGKGVPTAYEVRNLIQREVDSPIERMKRKLAAANRLRLPPPSAPVERVTTGELIDGTTGEVIEAGSEPEKVPADQGGKAKGAAK